MENAQTRQTHGDGKQIHGDTGDRGRGRGRVTIRGYGASFWGDGHILTQMVMTAEVCEYTKNHRIVHLKWTNPTVCELYLNKDGPTDAHTRQSHWKCSWTTLAVLAADWRTGLVRRT